MDLLFWKEIFEDEKAILSKIFMRRYIVIEHVGSTSIPNIVAKPIIDIAVGLKSLNNSAEIIKTMEDHGYIYYPEHEDRLLFIKENQMVRTHHIHVEEYGKQSWNNHIYFRNSLLENNNLQKEYMELKKSLAAKYQNDREQYTAHKAEFIQRVISLYRPDDKQ